MTKWDQQLVTLDGPNTIEINDMLTKLGAEGWELVNHTAPARQHSREWTFTFKRPA